MRIALIDFVSGGHHDSYVRLYAVVLEELGHKVTCIGPQAMVTQLPPETSNVALPEAASGERPTGRAAVKRWCSERWQHAAAAVRQLGDGVDLAVFLYADTFADALLPAFRIDQLFPFPWLALYMAPTHLRKRIRCSVLRRGPLHPHHFLQARQCRGVLVLDEGIVDAMAATVRHCPVFAVPDVTDRTLQPCNWEFLEEVTKEKRAVVSLVGSLDARKGIETLLNAARLDGAAEFCFVLAGQPTPSAAGLLERFGHEDGRPANVLVWPRRIPSENHFNNLIAASDIVMAAYLDFPHSSNLLTKAAAFHRPVIVSDGYCMAERVRRFQLGLVTAGPDAGPLLACCKRVRQGLPWHGHYEAFSEQHSLAALKRILATALVPA